MLLWDSVALVTDLGRWHVRFLGMHEENCASPAIKQISSLSYKTLIGITRSMYPGYYVTVWTINLNILTIEAPLFD